MPPELGGGVVAVIRDVTEAKALERELEKRAALLTKANRDLLHFAYAVSHDLLAPLRTIRSFSELLALSYGGNATLAVTDSGIGMPREMIGQIFEPFFTTKGAGCGTGLGLSMVQGIVEQSGGYVDVISEVGHGATLTIYLPALANASTRSDTISLLPNFRGDETILVVEDQPEVRNFAAAALRSYGYRVLQSANAGEALAICERERDRIHLVLTDVVMPGMSGRELVERLKDLRPGIKVLFMSGYTDDAVIQRGVIGEGVPFLQKPFTPETLTATLRAALGVAGAPGRILVADAALTTP